MRDTRDKAGKHDNIDGYILANGHTIVRNKLFVGDTALLLDQSCCIDHKQNLMEVCGNVTHEHERFEAECLRAKENGIHLIVLIEESPKFKTLQDVPHWFNPRLRVSPYAVSGEKLYKIMATMQRKYGVDWRFTTRAEAGKTAVEILIKEHELTLINQLSFEPNT